MTPTADDLKVELLAHACKLPASGPPPRAGRPARAASAGAELPATFMGASGTQLAQPPMAFPACSSCPPEFWGKLLQHPPSATLPSTLQDIPPWQCTMQSHRYVNGFGHILAGMTQVLYHRSPSIW